VNIHEAGGDNVSPCIYPPLGLRALQVTYSLNLITNDADVSPEPSVLRAVDDVPAFEKDIESQNQSPDT
jgi:hypothetical protein